MRSQKFDEKITHLIFFLCLFKVIWKANIVEFLDFCSDDCRSWPREEKINNHGCCGKHAHIPDNDYWGICLFHVVWTNFFWAIILHVVHTEYIIFFLFWIKASFFYEWQTNNIEIKIKINISLETKLEISLLSREYRRDQVI
jgi:hypothetical protein